MIPPENSDKTMREHFRATLILGLPLVGAQLAQMMVNVIDTIMLGWLGSEELAAGTLAFQVLFILLIFGLGFGAAMMPLIAGALGSDDARAVRRCSRMGLWALFALSVLFQIPLWFTRDFLLLLGQQENLAELAQSYMRFAQWSLIPAFIVIGLRSILTSFEKANAVLLTTLFAVVLNAILNYALIFGNFGAPRLEMVGAGIATTVSTSVTCLMVWVYVMRVEIAKPYQIFIRLWRPDWFALKEITFLGLPISLTIFAEAGLFSAASVMIGWIGTIELAAHGIGLQVASIAFMVPLGFAQAGSVRVGNALGRRSLIDVGRAGYITFAIAVVFSVFSALVFILIPETLIGFFVDFKNTDAAQLVQAAVPLIWVAAAFQLVDSVQVVASGGLRGLQDTKIPMIIAFLSYWGVGLAVAYVLAFPAGYGAPGVWAGLACGLAVAAIALTHRFANREKLGLLRIS
jgi:MATE family multidrug resistance protein